MRTTWQPAWVTERRQPAFTGVDLAPAQSFGKKKYLWGNVPAFDVLQLARNEGASYAKDLSILFAASGDLRNVVKTVASLPATYNRTLTLTINDLDFDVVARNAILLLVAASVEDSNAATETVLHMWYSALIRPQDWDILQSKVRPLIEDVVKKIANRDASIVQRKTWAFGACTIRIALTKAQWSMLLSHLSIPDGLDKDTAQRVRQRTTLAPERVDYRDRRSYCQTPSHRTCGFKFAEEGILVPFGQSTASFTIPNPTFFQTADWPMMDSADPHTGWDFWQVDATPCGRASNDVLGKLFLHVKATLATFHSRLRTHKQQLELFNVNATTLPTHISGRTYARIELSNICDGFYLGTRNTISVMAPLLQPAHDNPKATIIMLYLNAVEEMKHEEGENISAKEEMLKASKYMPPTATPRSPFGAELVKYMASLSFFTDKDKYFNRYMKAENFQDIARAYGVKIKDKHTIIEKWPLRLKLGPEQKRGRDEFERLLGSDHTGVERYVELCK